MAPASPTFLLTTAVILNLTLCNLFGFLLNNYIFEYGNYVTLRSGKYRSPFNAVRETPRMLRLIRETQLSAARSLKSIFIWRSHIRIRVRVCFSAGIFAFGRQEGRKGGREAGIQYVREFSRVTVSRGNCAHGAKYRQERFRGSENAHCTFVQWHDKSNGYGNLVR